MPLPSLLIAIQGVLLLAPLLLEGSQVPDIGTVIQQLSGHLVYTASQFLLAVDSAVLQLSRLAYITAFLIGALLHLTRLRKGLGSGLITGGVVLAALSEFIFPLLLRL